MIISHSRKLLSVYVSRMANDKKPKVFYACGFSFGGKVAAGCGLCFGGRIAIVFTGSRAPKFAPSCVIYIGLAVWLVLLYLVLLSADFRQGQRLR